jgi:cell fate (sporulation/competence/biofilm development) regulator YmcA (YheA/YmcA/DUF963 family)
METILKKQEVLTSNNPRTLRNIQKSNSSAVIWEREISPEFQKEIINLLALKEFELFKTAGNVEKIKAEILSNPVLKKFPELTEDLQYLLKEFTIAANCKNVKFELSAFSDDRCRKFHTDITDYRLLCTYAGPGTMYILPENAAKVCSCDECDINPDFIKRVAVPHVMIFRGALVSSDEAPPLLHKSPAVENSGEKRLLLRIDTNEFGLFDTYPSLF